MPSLLRRLGIDKSLDLVQPPDVFALLLHINVVRHKDSQRLRDTTVLEEALHQHLQILIEGSERRAGVDVGAALRSLGRLGAGDGRILKVEDVVDGDVAALGGRVDGQGALALAGLLD